MKAGFAKVCITPPIGSALTGFIARSGVATAVHDDIFVRSLVFEQSGRAVAILSIEVLALSAETVAAIRDRVSKCTGIVAGDIMVAATHTHSGPVTIRTFFNDHEEPDAAYVEQLIDAAAESASSAWRSRCEASVGVGSCFVEGVGVNRRVPGGVPVDRQAAIIRVDTEGRTRAIAVVYGCHPTVLGFKNLEITGDFPAATVAALESGIGPGGFAMFLNGAEADVSIGHSAELSLAGVSNGNRTFEYAKNVGERLATAVLGALPEIATSRTLAIGSAKERLVLDGREYPPVDETIGSEAESLDEKTRRIYNSIHLANARNLAALGGQVSVELQAIRIGTARFIGVPGEIFAETSLRWKRSSPGPLFPVGLANGYVGYLPPPHAFSQGGYEAEVASCAPDSELRLSEAVARLAAS